MDNPFIQTMMQGQLGAKFSRDDVKENANDVKAVFTLVEPTFIIRQVEPDKLVSCPSHYMLMFKFADFTIAKLTLLSWISFYRRKFLLESKEMSLLSHLECCICKATGSIFGHCLVIYLF